MRIILPCAERTFISSDFHHMHKNICTGCTSWSSGATRSYDSPEEMSDALVSNINSTVGVADWLIHLGDWASGGAGKVEEFRNRIKCRNIICLMGNHDQDGNFAHQNGEWVRRKESRFTKDLFSLTCDYLEFRYKKTLYCLSHYPLASWNEQGRGSCHAFGHTHGNLDPSLIRGRMLEVGVDIPRWNFRPVRLPDLHDIFMEIPIKVNDHVFL